VSGLSSKVRSDVARVYLTELARIRLFLPSLYPFFTKARTVGSKGFVRGADVQRRSKAACNNWIDLAHDPRRTVASAALKAKRRHFSRPHDSPAPAGKS